MSLKIIINAGFSQISSHSRSGQYLRYETVGSVKFVLVILREQIEPTTTTKDLSLNTNQMLSQLSHWPMVEQYTNSNCAKDSVLS